VQIINPSLNLLKPATTRAVNVAFDDEIGIGHPVLNSGEMGLKRREPQQSVNNTINNCLYLVLLVCKKLRVRPVAEGERLGGIVTWPTA